MTEVIRIVFATYNKTSEQLYGMFEHFNSFDVLLGWGGNSHITWSHLKCSV